MKYEILDIAPADAFYDEKDKYIGRVMELEVTERWKKEDEWVVGDMVFAPHGYCSAQNDGIVFHAVKIRKAKKHAPR